jgi:hypothetical protein
MDLKMVEPVKQAPLLSFFGIPVIATGITVQEENA